MRFLLVALLLSCFACGEDLLGDPNGSVDSKSNPLELSEGSQADGTLEGGTATAHYYVFVPATDGDYDIEFSQDAGSGGAAVQYGKGSFDAVISEGCVTSGDSRNCCNSTCSSAINDPDNNGLVAGVEYFFYVSSPSLGDGETAEYSLTVR